MDLLGVGTINRWAGFLATLTAIFVVLIRKNLRPLSSTQISLIIFASWAIFSFTWSDYPTNSQDYVFTYASNIVLVLIFSQFVSSDREISPIFIAYLLGTLYIGMALLEYKFFFTSILGQGSIEYEGGRLTVFGNNENELALGFALGVPVAWYVAIRKIRTWHQYLGWFFIPIASLGTLLTGSRAGLLCLGLAMVIIMIGPLFTKSRGRSSIFMFVLILGFASQANTFMDYSETTVKRMESAIQGGSDQYSEADTRTLVWKKGLGKFFSDTGRLLNGCGLGAFIQYVPPTNGKRFVSHNAYIGVLVELGLIGIFLFFGIIIICVAGLLKMTGLERTLWISLFAGWIVFSLFGNTEYAKHTWLFFGLYASRITYVTLLRESKNKKKVERQYAV